MSEHSPRRPRNDNNNQSNNPLQSILVFMLAVACISLVVFTLIAVARNQNIQLQNPDQPEITGYHADTGGGVRRAAGIGTGRFCLAHQSKGKDCGAD